MRFPRALPYALSLAFLGLSVSPSPAQASTSGCVAAAQNLWAAQAVVSAGERGNASSLGATALYELFIGMVLGPAFLANCSTDD
jgi:hypothetical protein